MRKSATNIMLVDDEDKALRSLSILLRTQGFSAPIQVSDSAKVIDEIREHSPSVVLLDLHMPKISGVTLLEEIKSTFPDTIVIIITADAQVDMAVKCTQLGAYDYFIKPIDHQRLIQIINKSLESKQLNDELISIQRRLLKSTKTKHNAFSSILTCNESMHQLFKYIEAISESNRPVLILGETGTGKELFAKAVHDVSEKAGKLVCVNVAGLDDTAFSDSLFGHKKGAFTGAQSSRDGLIKQASQGTIFLDEIGDLRPESQIKLLRLIQENNYYPLGSDELSANTARIITATHHSLDQLIEDGSFRKDLFYRLHIHSIHIPPLRERREDIPLLCQHFIQKACLDLQCQIPLIPDELFELFDQYSFPGNVRELEMLIYDACINTTGKFLNTQYIAKKVSSIVNNTASDSHSLYTFLEEVEELPTIKEITESLIDEALSRADNNQSVASKTLGLTRQALNKRLIRRDL